MLHLTMQKQLQKERKSGQQLYSTTATFTTDKRALTKTGRQKCKHIQQKQACHNLKLPHYKHLRKHIVLQEGKRGLATLHLTTKKQLAQNGKVRTIHNCIQQVTKERCNVKKDTLCQKKRYLRQFQCSCTRHVDSLQADTNGKLFHFQGRYTATSYMK